MRAAGCSRRRCGASAAEFAVVLPVLLLIVLGLIDFGRFAYYHVAVTNAARAGAEYAIMTPYVPAAQAAWNARVQETARDEMTNQIGYDPADLTTATTVTVERTGLRRVRVEATYASFQTVTSWPGIPSSLTIRSAVTMRVIR
ncbi:MAG TPA: TadE/TadG family type IV pilus assembly protein [Fimbriiglobus sp.]|nr:TadE/TadG family type IV pilus assembly protein [Fimbriiglobus sp.]